MAFRNFPKYFLVSTTVLFAIPFFVFAGNLGDKQNFLVSSAYDVTGRNKIDATLRLLGEKGEYFVEDAYWNERTSAEQTDLQQKISRLADEFDRRIYPLETSFWGSEPNPGIDNNPRVIFLLSNLVTTAGGYYDTSNQYPKSQVGQSNEKELIFINIRSLQNETRAFTFIAHEFQHLISFNQKNLQWGVNEDTWLNELRSEYAPTFLGYSDGYANSNLRRRVATFIDEPSDSLTEWPNEAKDYGQVDLFGEYLVEHFGASLLSDSLKINKVGIASLNQTFLTRGYQTTMDEVFMDWAVANVLNDTNLKIAYGYFRDGLRQDLKILPTQSVTSISDQIDLSMEHQFKDWQAKWFWFSGFQPGSNNVLQISFSGPKQSFFRVAIILFSQGGNRQVKFLNLSQENQASTYLPLFSKEGANNDLEKIIVIPVKMEKRSDFSSLEDLSPLKISLKRLAAVPALSPLPPPSSSVVSSNVSPRSKPADFGLREGDFIRADGDIDVYIVNNFGYKRLVLNPKICRQYRHLGKRGCFSAVKLVSPEVRDAFLTSWYFKNGEAKDHQVYFLEATGGDSALLRQVQISGEEFKQQGGDFNAVFLFNTLEQKSYPRGASLKKLIN